LNYWLLRAVAPTLWKNLDFFLATLKLKKKMLDQIVLVTLRAHHSFTLMPACTSFWDCLPASVCYCDFWLVIDIRLLSRHRLSWRCYCC
jgi:hypothetical protein